jgi:quercetin dioxygenase-like cupin family protein
MHEKKKVEQPGGMPAGEALDLGSLVAYQEGSIVSRTLVKRKGGTVTLFAFDVDQALSEHTAPFDALAEILDGEADLTIGGAKVSPKAGQSVLMPATVPHAVYAPKRFKMLLTMIREV